MRSFIERLMPRRRPIIIAIHAGLVVVAYAVTLSSLVFSGMVLVIIGRSFAPAVLFLDWLLCLALVGGCGWPSQPCAGSSGVLASRKTAERSGRLSLRCVTVIY